MWIIASVFGVIFLSFLLSFLLLLLEILAYWSED